MMTHQEVFNVVYAGLRSQGFRRCHDNGGCKYRHDGMKCAFGHLVPDEQYDPQLENHSADGLLDGAVITGTQARKDYIDPELYDSKIAFFTKFKEWGDTVFPVDLNGKIRELQRIHDNNDIPKDMDYMLQSYALGNNLTIPE